MSRNSYRHSRRKAGFTIIELLISVGVVVVLMGVMVVAINPGERLAEVRNNKRRADVETLYSGIERYIYQNRGDLPGADGFCFNGKIDGETFDAYECEVYLTRDFVDAEELPRDPVCGEILSTGYLFVKDETGIGVSANCAELGEEITAGYWPE